MEIRYAKVAAKYLLEKLVLAWDPDFTKVTPGEDAAITQAMREMDAGEYVPHSAINWD